MDKGVRDSQALMRASQRLVDRSHQRIRDARKLMMRALHVQQYERNAAPSKPEPGARR